MSVYGGIEAGGSKFECAVGTAPDDLHALETIPTTTPGETIDRVVAFFERRGPVAAIGIGSFGPVDADGDSPTWGYITSTPKPGWANTSVAQELQRRLSVAVAFDTDVNAAALGEHRWGAARGLDTFCYVTVGTGIGGGAMAGGKLLHGFIHPEFGHMRIPHDLEQDPFPGVCPFHGDCWEGLASGRALERRWGRSPAELDGDPRVWSLEAQYLALGLVSVVYVLSPERILVGGGVMRHPGLLPLVQRDVARLMNGYQHAPTIMLPALSPRSGVLGALALAESA
ncbi:MAG TPA: ROK family protein [Gaiellaceae bacterium]|nr:ROK family protein [Gaiellaceae bacterium]